MNQKDNSINHVVRSVCKSQHLPGTSAQLPHEVTQLGDAAFLLLFVHVQ